MILSDFQHHASMIHRPNLKFGNNILIHISNQFKHNEIQYVCLQFKYFVWFAKVSAQKWAVEVILGRLSISTSDDSIWSGFVDGARWLTRLLYIPSKQMNMIDHAPITNIIFRLNTAFGMLALHRVYTCLFSKESGHRSPIPTFSTIFPLFHFFAWIIHQSSHLSLHTKNNEKRYSNITLMLSKTSYLDWFQIDWSSLM